MSSKADRQHSLVIVKISGTYKSPAILFLSLGNLLTGSIEYNIMSQKNWLYFVNLLLVAQLSLIGFVYFVFAIRAEGQFIAQRPDEDTFQLAPMDRPNVSTKALLSWVTLAATSSFSFDFVNYKDQLTKLQDYFTTDGYDNFISSLDSAGFLKSIEEKKLVLSAVAVGPAIVLTENGEGNKHTWRIQVPLLVRYQSANVNETRLQVVDVLIAQVSTKDAPKGIGIAQYIAREAGPEVAV